MTIIVIAPPRLNCAPRRHLVWGVILSPCSKSLRLCSSAGHLGKKGAPDDDERTRICVNQQCSAVLLAQSPL